VLMGGRTSPTGVGDDQLRRSRSTTSARSTSSSPPTSAFYVVLPVGDGPASCSGARGAGGGALVRRPPLPSAARPRRSVSKRRKTSDRVVRAP
jgi:hypothetical protein